MNSIDTVEQVAQVPPQRPPVTVLKALAGIARWTWRVVSILLMLFAGVFIMAGFAQGSHISKDPEDLVLIAAGIVAFAAFVLAWWR